MKYVFVYNPASGLGEAQLRVLLHQALLELQRKGVELDYMPPFKADHYMPREQVALMAVPELPGLEAWARMPRQVSIEEVMERIRQIGAA